MDNPNILQTAIDNLINDLKPIVTYEYQGEIRRIVNYWAHKHIETYYQERIETDDRAIKDAGWINHTKKHLAFSFAEALIKNCSEDKYIPLKEPVFRPVTHDLDKQFYGPRALKLSVQVFALKRQHLED